MVPICRVRRDQRLDEHQGGFGPPIVQAAGPLTDFATPAQSEAYQKESQERGKMKLHALLVYILQDTPLDDTSEVLSL
ncbi:hypothetical protein RB195_025349 [Necator americanus]|uniref:Uncharacterized protein n=1 Tax=Necator americanus TaxID=51031 RepID=A0ABR1ESJ4_NECAM